ncbi:MAG TPA: DUF3592 domain-containing protein [Thermoanaerobaculia bacterium]
MHDHLRFTAPPRRVPLSLRVVNFFNGWAQIGWGVFGFGMIFFWIFGASADFSGITFRNPGGRTTGHVMKVEETGASENEQPISASHYQYSVAGELFNGKSYTTGGAPAVGDEVTVEFDEDSPGRSRIEGMRRAMFGPWAAIVAIFPAIGLVFLIPGTLKGRNRNHLLENGILARGTFVDRRPTNMRINNRPVWEVVFEFHDRNGQRRECCARAVDTTRLEDEASEALLYDPEDPSKAYVLDEAPARPSFDHNGDLQGRPAAAVLAMIVPGIVIGLNALLLYAKLT